MGSDSREIPVRWAQWAKRESPVRDFQGRRDRQGRREMSDFRVPLELRAAVEGQACQVTLVLRDSALQVSTRSVMFIDTAHVVCRYHTCKKNLYVFSLILVTFLRFLTFFYFPNVFLF